MPLGLPIFACRLIVEEAPRYFFNRQSAIVNGSGNRISAFRIEIHGVGIQWGEVVDYSQGMNVGVPRVSRRVILRLELRNKERSKSC